MRTYSLVWFFILLSFSSGQTCSNSETGIHRAGSWYTYIQSITSVESCCTMCNAETARCQSWLFVRPGTSISPGCFLYQNIPSINQSSTCGQYCTSGYKSASLPTNGRCAYPGGVFELAIDRPGSTYARLINVENYSVCCALCQIEGDRCRAWTFIRNGAPGKESGCALKNQVPTISNTPCVACTSGIK